MMSSIPIFKFQKRIVGADLEQTNEVSAFGQTKPKGRKGAANASIDMGHPSTDIDAPFHHAENK